ncbi:MAG: hypothetical protein BWY85_01941 [Firmicutes bacterium ADurb.Bin506]|nr:MAG: hypothetical protein BWY85_01941 [Firmicutes bacterium ADurb.Bin506]
MLRDLLPVGEEKYAPEAEGVEGCEMSLSYSGSCHDKALLDTLSSCLLKVMKGFDLRPAGFGGCGGSVAALSRRLGLLGNPDQGRFLPCQCVGFEHILRDLLGAGVEQRIEGGAELGVVVGVFGLRESVVPLYSIGERRT